MQRDVQARHFQSISPCLCALCLSMNTDVAISYLCLSGQGLGLNHPSSPLLSAKTDSFSLSSSTTQIKPEQYCKAPEGEGGKWSAQAQG